MFSKSFNSPWPPNVQSKHKDFENLEKPGKPGKYQVFAMFFNKKRGKPEKTHLFGYTHTKIYRLNYLHEDSKNG